MVNFFVSRFSVNKNAQTSSRTRTHAAAATRDVLVWMPGRNSLTGALENFSIPRSMLDQTVELEPSAWSAWTTIATITVDSSTRTISSPAPSGPSAWMPLENMPPVQQPLGAATSMQPPAAATKPHGVGKGSSTHVAPAAAARARAGAPERSHAPLREQRATTASINCVTGSLLSLALAQQVDES